MRKEFWLMLLVNGSIILFLLYQVADLITLLHDDAEIFNFNSTLINDENDKTQLQIPKIIHQTYINTSIPEKWQSTHQSVLELNPDFEFRLWTDEMARDFIATNYEWFLKTYDSYPYNIMRADVIRYFVLFHYGGIYIDLDNGCLKNLDPLLNVPAWLRKTIPTGVSNDLMGSVPGHPFFEYVTNNLMRFNHNWFVSYITIMYSTGPLFLSVLWKRYKRWGVAANAEVRILDPLRNHTSEYFYQGKGSSWHQDDAKMIFILGRHWFLVTIFGVCLGLLFFYAQYKLYQKVSFTWLNKMRRRTTRVMVKALNKLSGRRTIHGAEYGKLSNSDFEFSDDGSSSDEYMLTEVKESVIKIDEVGYSQVRPRSRNENLV